MPIANSHYSHACNRYSRHSYTSWTAVNLSKCGGGSSVGGGGVREQMRWRLSSWVLTKNKGDGGGSVGGGGLDGLDSHFFRSWNC